MLNINKFLDNLESYQEIGANALNIEHNFSIGGISMMQAVLGVATLGIGILISVVVYNSISTALPAPTPGTTLSTLFNSTTTQFSASLTIGLVVLIVSMAALVLKVIKEI